MGTAAQRWQADLEQWRIPAEVEGAATRSPWGHPADRFALRADTALTDRSGVSYRRAVEALSPPGTVLDVGAGVGAGGLPLLARATALTAVDPSAEMLELLASRAARVAPEVPTTTVVGRWPHVADRVGSHDVVVCHHVVYDVPEIEAFLGALTAAARRRVVLEVPPVHPQTWMAPLWLQFHGIVRPSTPTTDDLAAVLVEQDVRGLTVDRWTAPDPGHPVDLALITRRLCLPVEAEPDVARAREQLAGPARDLVTLTWSGQAR